MQWIKLLLSAKSILLILNHEEEKMHDEYKHISALLSSNSSKFMAYSFIK